MTEIHHSMSDHKSSKRSLSLQSCHILVYSHWTLFDNILLGLSKIIGPYQIRISALSYQLLNAFYFCVLNPQNSDILFFFFLFYLSSPKQNPTRLSPTPLRSPHFTSTNTTATPYYHPYTL